MSEHLGIQTKWGDDVQHALLMPFFYARLFVLTTGQLANPGRTTSQKKQANLLKEGALR
jgi:hypothetical protein